MALSLRGLQPQNASRIADDLHRQRRISPVRCRSRPPLISIMLPWRSFASSMPSWQSLISHPPPLALNSPPPAFGLPFCALRASFRSVSIGWSPCSLLSRFAVLSIPPNSPARLHISTQALRSLVALFFFIFSPSPALVEANPSSPSGLHRGDAASHPTADRRPLPPSCRSSFRFREHSSQRAPTPCNVCLFLERSLQRFACLRVGFLSHDTVTRSYDTVEEKG